MPKLKTHSGTKDKIRVTRNGKVIRRKANGNHNMSKKSHSRKRTLVSPKLIGGTIAKNIKKNLGVK
ncbi:50S ribosomal protein L35 [Candidatus Saccharibacteria bacterium]|nr:50S ribosomal protein L35 [Candidatus Saccharibacteria bacterium]MCB9821265.1 50S ribosomal protein L35 [Candidatus Nomurabacteria bacterium]